MNSFVRTGWECKTFVEHFTAHSTALPVQTNLFVGKLAFLFFEVDVYRKGKN